MADQTRFEMRVRPYNPVTAVELLFLIRCCKWRAIRLKIMFLWSETQWEASVEPTYWKNHTRIMGSWWKPRWITDVQLHYRPNNLQKRHDSSCPWGFIRSQPRQKRRCHCYKTYARPKGDNFLIAGGKRRVLHWVIWAIIQTAAR